MMVLRSFIAFLVCCCCLLNLGAQIEKECYQRFLKEGIAAQQTLDFDTAVRKFEAAKICPDKPLQHDLDSLLEAVNMVRISALTRARDQAREAEEQALQQLMLSEGGRLAFLANQEREKGNAKIALKLAYRAMEMTGDQVSTAIRRAFGDAVYRYTRKDFSGHHRAILSVDYSHDGQRILTVSEDSSLIVWSATGDLLWQQQFNAPIQSAHFSPDGQRVLTASGTQAGLWNLKGKRLQLFDEQTDLVYVAKWSKQGQWLAICSRDQKVVIRNAVSGQQQAICQGVSAAVTQIHFSPDDNYLLGITADQALLVWNLQGVLLHRIQHRQRYFGGALFGPQTHQLVTYTVDHQLQIWNSDQAQLQFEQTAHEGMIRGLTIAPQQNGFLSYSTDGNVVFWNEKGQEQFRLDHHLAPINKVVFSQDGNYILTASADATAKMYQQDGQLLMDLSGFSDSVNDVAIAVDNQQISVVGGNPKLTLCQNPITYYEYLKMHPPEAFTPEEKEKYMIIE